LLLKKVGGGAIELPRKADPVFISQRTIRTGLGPVNAPGRNFLSLFGLPKGPVP
jgi:hypothetical protein